MSQTKEVDTFSLPAEELDMPFSILDTDLYKVNEVNKVRAVADDIVDNAKCSPAALSQCAGRDPVQQPRPADALLARVLRLDPGEGQSCVRFWALPTKLTVRLGDAPPDTRGAETSGRRMLLLPRELP